jgi:formylglycine-generating enzyme required for sulfatase activity
MRNTNATWDIPTENEWYKAAYYNPATSSYYVYPCSSVNFPISTMPGSTPNAANLYDSDTGYAVTDSTSYSSSQNYLTDVGAYTASASPDGAFDMGGDVWQWYSTTNMGLGVRGASWDFLASYEVASWYRYYNFGPTTEEDNIGFRVALVPEPSTLMLASIACGLLWTLRKKSK